MLLLLTPFGVTGLLFALTTYETTVLQLLFVFVTVRLYVPANVAVTTDVFAGPLIPGPDHVYVTPLDGFVFAVVLTAVCKHVIVPLVFTRFTVGVFTSGITVYTNAAVHPDAGWVLINVYVVAVPTLTVLLLTPLKNVPPLLVHV
jgi:hypothetical protein